jgi:23S rRNA (uracil1939-C5)-methyltransferase
MRRARRHFRPATDAAVLDLTIEDIGAQGDGIARCDGGTVFVPYTLPGDRVRARRVGPGHAVPQSWIARGALPHPSRCPHFGACGGCAVQHLDDDTYAAWKQSQLETTLARRGLDQAELMPMVRAQPAERRRADFGAERAGGRVTIGFHAYRSRTLVDIQACAVLHPAIAALLPALRGLMRDLLPDGRSADLLVTRTESGLDLLIGCVAQLDRSQREGIASFAAAHDLARIAWRHANETPETLIQQRVPRVTFADVLVDVPAGAFLQASKSGEDAIVAAALVGIAGARRVADLFAGCGTLSFPLASAARVHAVEGAADLAEALAAAARRSNRAGRITVETRDLARRPLLADELEPFDAIVFDPPRDGAAAQAAEIARSRISKVVGASCNPATFARDARILVDAGFRLVRVTPIDQFLWSPHLELVGVFER